MKMYLLKWAVAGLIWPTLFLVTSSSISWSQEYLLLFWPSSIVLMSLGSGSNEASYIAFVWSVGALLNVITYLVIGCLLRLIILTKQHTDNENS